MKKEIKCKRCKGNEFKRYMDEKAYCKLEYDTKNKEYTDKDVEILERDYEYVCINCGASLNDN